MLAAELERWRSLPRTEIAARAEAPAVAAWMETGDGMICIEVRIRWSGERRRQLRVEAVAYGASHWKLERLEEAIVLEAVD